MKFKVGDVVCWRYSWADTSDPGPYIYKVTSVHLNTDTLIETVKAIPVNPGELERTVHLDISGDEGKWTIATANDIKQCRLTKLQLALVGIDPILYRQAFE